MTNKSRKSIFDSFDDLSLNTIDESFEAAQQFLAELNIDSNEVGVQGANDFKKYIFLSKAKENQTKDASLLEQVKDRLKELIQHNAQLTGEILQNALAQRSTSFQFRNLEKWSDDELREVLSDSDLTKILEDLEDIED
ncbi:hypothetical protein [Marinoscillum sp.]|uniref:hypothetical protein n=1 Tax=Marinoscillum sp. TaxID=2024838 RepID=UPI003BAC4DF4